MEVERWKCGGEKEQAYAVNRVLGAMESVRGGRVFTLGWVECCYAASAGVPYLATHVVRVPHEVVGFSW